MRSVKNCSVAVVGGAGFLGSHLVQYLVEERHCKVLVLDNLCAGRREFVHPDAEFHHCDITGSEEHLRNVFKKAKIHFVFNYAAEPYIPDSFRRPIHVFNVNAFGAMKVINAAWEAGCEGILQVSSAEIYGNAGMHFEKDEEVTAEGKKINEHGAVVPHSSYGAAKAAIDAMVQVRWREAGTPCIALRQFNCVGERETHPYVVPEIISQLAKQKNASTQPLCLHDHYEPAVIKLGNNSFRDFQYAGDAVESAVLLLERGNFGEVYNMGSESGIKIYDLAKLIGQVMGFSDVRVEVDEERKRPWEIWHLQSDNTKLWNAIGNKDMSGTWNMRPTPMPLEEALKKTVAWYEENGRKWPWERCQRA